MMQSGDCSTQLRYYYRHREKCKLRMVKYRANKVKVAHRKPATITKKVIEVLSIGWTLADERRRQKRNYMRERGADWSRWYNQLYYSVNKDRINANRRERRRHEPKAA